MILWRDCRVRLWNDALILQEKQTGRPCRIYLPDWMFCFLRIPARRIWPRIWECRFSVCSALRPGYGKPGLMAWGILSCRPTCPVRPVQKVHPARRTLPAVPPSLIRPFWPILRGAEKLNGVFPGMCVFCTEPLTKWDRPGARREGIRLITTLHCGKPCATSSRNISVSLPGDGLDSSSDQTLTQFSTAFCC